MNNSAAHTTKKPGRNDACPCGSGKKYKACCINRSATGTDKTQTTAADALKLAWQAVARRDMAATLHWFQQVLQVDPNHAEALAGLGQALCWQQKRREGLSYLQQAARQLETHAQKSRDIRFVLELAEQLHHWGDMDTALNLTALAVKLAPNDPAAINNRALYLTRVNRWEEALPYAEKVCQLRPKDPACNNLLAILQAQLKQYSTARLRFNQVIQDNLNPDQTARAWQELVGVLDKLGEYDASFAACLEAKALYRQLPAIKKLDAEQIFKCIALNKSGFDSALINTWSMVDFTDHLPKPTFLLGFLRSGTTLTERVLGAHTAVFTSDENDLIHGLTQELKRMTGCGDDLPRGLRKLGLTEIKNLRLYYWRRVEEEYGEQALQRCFIDKVALNSINVGLIAHVFPEARLIFALRDPRDVCLSCFQQAFMPSTVSVNLMDWEGVARQYAAVMDLWLHLKPMLPTPYLELRYEDTVNHFETTFRQVFAFLSLDWNPEVNNFHQQAKGQYIATPSFAAVSEPIYASAVARWRHYEKNFWPVLPILERYIDAFGYASV